MDNPDFTVNAELIYDKKSKEVVIVFGTTRSTLFKADIPNANGNVYTEEALKGMVEHYQNNPMPINITLN